MANFEKAIEKMLSHEGGYVNDPSDPGGETYKGVARKMFSKWEGWTTIDIAKRSQNFPKNLDADTNLHQLITQFYKVNFWDKINADDILNEDVAFSIFDFGVNAGVSTSAGLAQKVIETIADGVFGKKSVEKLNAFDPDHFIAAFTVAKIARYLFIVKRRPESRKYFYGWVNRALNG